MFIFPQLVDAQSCVVCRVPRERPLPGYSRGCGRADGPPCARGTACEPRAHDHSRWHILPETNASGQGRNGGDHTKGPLWCRSTSHAHFLSFRLTPFSTYHLQTGQKVICDVEMKEGNVQYLRLKNDQMLFSTRFPVIEKKASIHENS